MSGDEEILGRFKREAQAAARVSHPNVAAATDFGQTADGSFFLVLEYVQGQSLRTAIDERGIVPPARALHITRQIALGLERAHEAGIIHRDLKPDNIMLVDKDGDPDFVKILDFGIARIEPHALAGGKNLVTRHGTIIGTPEYMSPEQAAGEPAGAAADFYSVGIMLYEMLSNKIPFDAEERAQILNLHINAKPPSMLVPVPPPVEALVMRLLAKTPAERPTNAAQLRAEVEAAAGQSGIELAHARSNPQLQRVSNPGLPREPSSPQPPSSNWQTSDALAKTEYGIKSDPALLKANAQTIAGTPHAIASGNLGIPGFKLGPLDKLPRPLVIGILGAPFFLIAFVIVVIASLASHHAGTSETGEGGVAAASSSAGPAKAVRASAAQIVSAKASGVAALESLSNEFPNDPAVLAELARAYANAGRTGDLLKIMKSLDPAAIDDELLGAVIAAALKPEFADDAYATMEGPMAGRGVDGLVELSSVKNRGISGRANRSLAKPEVRAHASPAANVFLDYRAAKDCSAKHDLLERAKDFGDTRLLAVLKPMQKEGGCGFLGHKDCFPCMRKDDDLGDAIRAIEGRNPQKL
jgi:serine/threonine-protein kinase